MIMEENIDLSFVKEWLQKGDIKEIAEESGYAPQYAYDILGGRKGRKNKNLPLLQKLYKKAFENANQFLAMREQQRILKQKISQL
jgi:hypothetical protein